MHDKMLCYARKITGVWHSNYSNLQHVKPVPSAKRLSRVFKTACTKAFDCVQGQGPEHFNAILVPIHSDGIDGIPCTCTVWLKKNPPRYFVTFSPKQLGVFSPNFTHLLNVPIYIGIQIFIQLSATLTKLFHIKSNQLSIMCSKCPPSTETHAGWSHLIWHNFVIVGDNWIKICIQAYI